MNAQERIERIERRRRSREVNQGASRCRRIAGGTNRRLWSLRALALALQLVFPATIRAAVIDHVESKVHVPSRRVDRRDLAQLAADMIEALRTGYEDGTRSTPGAQVFRDERANEHGEGRACGAPKSDRSPSLVHPA